MITGRIVYGNLSGKGARSGEATVYLDGQAVTDQFSGGTPPDSSTNTDCASVDTDGGGESLGEQPESRIVCDASDVDEQVEITLQVSGHVWEFGDEYDDLTTIINAGERTELWFSGTLTCFYVRGGHCDVSLRYRG